ncbi:hypothetical protein D3C81_1429580 [compost metagenome]
MLNVYSTDDIDTGIKDIHHILPSFFVFAAFYICMRQFINNNHFGSKIDNSLYIHFLKLLAFVK